MISIIFLSLEKFTPEMKKKRVKTKIYIPDDYTKKNPEPTPSQTENFHQNVS